MDCKTDKIISAMEKRNKIDIHKYTKILVPASSYDFKNDARLLIPFTSGNKIGFINQEGDIVVEPKYDMYYGDCFSTNDYIRVSILEMDGYPRSRGRIECYSHPLYGLINHKGELVLDTIYYNIIPSTDNKNIFTIHCKDKGYAVVDANGAEIIPYGKYIYINGFDRGVARIRVRKETNDSTTTEYKWGVIDLSGKEVLPTEYDDIWNFYGKTYPTIVVIKDGKSYKVPFAQLVNNRNSDQSQDECYTDDYGTHFGDYEGSYAQDEMGYSDDVINDAFDGDPEAYWNID